jgi:hypothetical protein
MCVSDGGSSRMMLLRRFTALCAAGLASAAGCTTFSPPPEPIARAQLPAWVLSSASAGNSPTPDSAQRTDSGKGLLAGVLQGQDSAHRVELVPTIDAKAAQLPPVAPVPRVELVRSTQQSSDAGWQKTDVVPSVLPVDTRTIPPTTPEGEWLPAGGTQKPTAPLRPPAVVPERGS